MFGKKSDLLLKGVYIVLDGLVQALGIHSENLSRDRKIVKPFFDLSCFFKGNPSVRVKEIDSVEEHRDFFGIQLLDPFFRIGPGETVSL